MRNKRVAVLFLFLSGFASYTFAQSSSAGSKSSEAIPRATPKDPVRHPHSTASRLLTADEGLSVIAAALESRVPPPSKADCSHLVHAIYERAGFSYSYVSSADLYAGTDEFRRVTHPQPGDLVVWPGHVGIVVNPAQHVFFSVLRSGRGIDSYDAAYWKGRGRARYYRYIKQGSAAESTAPTARTSRVTLMVGKPRRAE